MMDFSQMKIGDTQKLPSRAWKEENKAIYYAACEYAAENGWQFQVEDDGPKEMVNGERLRDYVIRRIR